MNLLTSAIEGLKVFCVKNVLFLFRRSNNRDVIIADLNRWQELIDRIPDTYPVEQVLIVLFRHWPEYRNLFYFRLKGDPVRKHFIFSLVRRLYPGKLDLVISSIKGIGPGLFIQHGRASGIAAQQIGSNCFINQHVSIGHNRLNEKPPILGNNVAVRAGAKIYGNIKIGDNVIIGANAVVLKDVPPNCTVVGVPGRIIKREGVRVDEPL